MHVILLFVWWEASVGDWTPWNGHRQEFLKREGKNREQTGL